MGSVMIVDTGIPVFKHHLTLQSLVYVYFVEQSPAICGTMPRLDKTFLTSIKAVSIVWS